MPNQVSRAGQQELDFPNTHGGKRRNAGRKRTLSGRKRVPHRPRQETKARFVEHVTVGMRPDIARLRNFELCPVLRRAFVHGCKKDEFRICQFSIQNNHIHLICEAASKATLARGIQGWKIRVARGLNKKLGRKGAVFEDRYHVEIIKTPAQCRAALCYVLQNARRHGLRLAPEFRGVDPFSSAWWFDGWSDHRWREKVKPPDMRTVAEAESWLLRVGWRHYAPIAIDEVPPAARREHS